MPRFILRFRGRGAAPSADLERIALAPGVVIVDDASPRTLLVEGPEDALRRVVSHLPDWVLSPEQSLPLPDTRRRPRDKA